MNSLRKTHSDFGGGKRMFNTKAKKQEKYIVAATKETIERSKENYPDYDFNYHTNIKLSDFRRSERNDTYIRPDGGMITASPKHDPSKEYVVLMSEAKHQGTNDARAEEGKKKQAMGNAVERAVKNVNECHNICASIGQSFVPYVIYCSGCDFAENSAIRDRLSGITENIGEIYITQKPQEYDSLGCEIPKPLRVTVKLKERCWELEEVIATNMEIIDQSMSFVKRYVDGR